MRGGGAIWGAAVGAAVLAMTTVVWAEQGPPSFRAAYQREKTELGAERAALQGELTELRARHEEQVKLLEAELASLQGSLSRSERVVEELEGELYGVNERLEGIEADHDLINSTLEVAGHSLARLGAEVDISGDAEDALARVYDAGVAKVSEASTVHRREGRFFSEGGVEMEGTIVHIGRVAALGVSESGGGVLARESNGGLIVVDASMLDRARRVAEGEALARTPVYILPPAGEASHSDPHRGLLQTIEAGGVIAWIIVALGGFAVLLMLERLVTLSLVSRRSRALVSTVEAHLQRGDIDAARRATRRQGALARVMSAVLAHSSEPREQLDEIAAEAVLKETPRLDRVFPMLNVIAAVSPLLGLLGTVSGMISTFEVITEYGTGDPRNLSGGISEALITTELGLAVAIPVLLLTSWLSRWSERIVEELQIQSLALINLMTSAVEPSEEARGDE